MLKEHPEKIHDQYTDKSGAILVKIASRMSDRKLAKLALDTLFNMERPHKKEAEFITDTAKDAFLSRIYFEGQRSKLSKEAAARIDKQIAVAEELHSVPVRVSFRKTAQKSQPEFSLLPMCKIASKEELVQAGNDFCRDFEKLSSRDRRVFARNFVKMAKAVGIASPDTVRLYACEGVEARNDIADNVLLRKTAMEGSVGHDCSFGILYDALTTTDVKDLSLPDLYKVAALLDATDNLYEIREKGHGKTIPDAWHSVFQIKKAEDAIPQLNVESMSKADIISRFGEGALEEVEDDEGEIDREKLKALVQAFGNGKAEDANPENS